MPFVGFDKDSAEGTQSATAEAQDLRRLMRLPRPMPQPHMCERCIYRALAHALVPAAHDVGRVMALERLGKGVPVFAE